MHPHPQRCAAIEAPLDIRYFKFEIPDFAEGKIFDYNGFGGASLILVSILFYECLKGEGLWL
jgi:hypothetical protein